GSISLRDRRKMVKKEKKNREKLIKEQKSVKPVNSKPDDKSDEDRKSTDNAEDKKAKVISFNSKKDTADKKDNKKTPEHKSMSDKLNKQKKKKIFLVIFILVFLVLAVVLYANRDFLTFSNISNWVQYDLFGDNSEETFPVSTGGDVITDGNFSRIDKNLVVASDTKFMTLNNYGKTIYSASQSFANPVLSQASDSDLSIVYNLGGKEFNIYSLDSTVYNGETEDSIFVADISSSGVYALVTAKEGYHSKLYVYSEDNALIYAYSFADYYITSVSLDSDGETAVLSGISTHDSSQLSSVYLLDFTLEEPVFFEEIYENVLYHTAHLNDDYIAIIGESASYVLDADSS
ncbi:MAG: DUF5711 family protein, partial [Eubacteriales bacterium]|nr:DUF5711 family protein [Eubacteriales bacterium]